MVDSHVLTIPGIITEERNRWFGVKVHLFSLISVIMFAFISSSPVLTLIPGGIIIFITYLWIGFFESKRTPAFFSPLSFYFFWHSINLGLSAVYHGNLIFSGERILFSQATVQYEYIVRGYLIYLLGSFFLHIGLQVLRPVTNQDGEKNNPVTSTGNKAVLFVVLFSLALEFLPQYFSPFGSLVNFLRWGLIASASFFALADPKTFRLNSGLHFLLILFGCTGIFLLNMSTTSKAYMMYAFFPLLWYLIMDRKKRKYLAVLIAFLIPFYFFVVYPVSYELRAQKLVGMEMDKSSAFNKVIKGNTASTKEIGGYGSDPVSAYLSRSFDPLASSYLAQQVDLYGFRNGETMGYMAFAFIPRVFWPDKPVVTQGGWFAYYLGFAPSPEESTMSLGISATGELFWNFGFTGVIAGMFLIGIGIGGLWRLAGDDPRKSVLSMLLFINLIFFMPNMSESGSVLVTIVSLFLVFKSLFVIRGVFFKRTARN